MGGGGENEDPNLEFTPTWVVALVCSFIVFISLCVERLLHYLGKTLKRKNQKPLYEALLKVKEELMLLGFISLLLTVFQGAIQNICIPKDSYDHMLPCEREHESLTTTEHYQTSLLGGHLGSLRRLLSGGGSGSSHCSRRGKIPLLSLEALHQLHIFIFVLAISHVTFCLLTMVLGSLRIQQWKHWEDSIQKAGENPENGSHGKVTHIHQLEFIQKRFKGFGKDSFVIRWLKQIAYGGRVMKQLHKNEGIEVIVSHKNGIKTHCPSNPKFNFHKYMMRALEADFKKVVGISWYLWIFVVVFLLLNINGWHTYFWIAFIPLVLLLAVGTKLEHVISQLAHEVAEKHTAIEGELVVKPSDDHFWFSRPRILLYLIHFILFQNAFEIAFFFWIWTTYGFDSCIMGQVRYIVPRLVIGVIIQVLCSYSTLPLYAIVTQMGSSFKKAIFDEHVQSGLVGWAQKVRQRKAWKGASGARKLNAAGLQKGNPEIMLQEISVQRTSQIEESHDPTPESNGSKST